MIPTTRKKQCKSINPKARWPQNWKTVWTAETVDPREFWRNHRQSFPRLFEIAKQTLFADYILSERRNRTSDENFENQLFANVNIDLPLSGVQNKLKSN